METSKIKEVIKSFDDLILPEEIKKQLKSREQNLILTGKPGVGKTSLVWTLANFYDNDIKFINAAAESGIDVARNIEQRINSFSIDHKGKKMVVFNEAERLTKDMQAAMKTIIENRTDVIWVFTTNINNLDSAIQSRCTTIDFDALLFNAAYKKEMVNQLANRTLKILDGHFTVDDIKANFKASDIEDGVRDIRQWTDCLHSMIESKALFKITIHDGEGEQFQKFCDAVVAKNSKAALESIKGTDPDALIYYMVHKVIPEFEFVKNSAGQIDWGKNAIADKLSAVTHDYDFRLRVVKFPYLATKVFVSNIIKCFG